MQLRLPFLMLGLIGLAIVFLGHSSGAGAIQGQDRTGSPLTNGSCANCHNGGSFNPQLQVQLLDNGEEVTSYIGGETYTMRFTVTSNGAAAYGFQAVALIGDTDEQAGDFSNPPSGTQITTLSGREYAEHSQRSTSGVWEIEWTAPDVGSGETRVYMAGNAVNNADGSGGDSPTTLSSPLVLIEETSNSSDVQANIQNIRLAPNPAYDNVQLGFTLKAGGKYQCQIVDMRGVPVEVTEGVYSVGYNQVTFNTNELPVGVYQVLVTNGQELKTARFLKQ